MNKVKFIGEIGKNWVVTQQEEPLDVLLARAKQLILAAKQAGCDVAKFQTHCVEDEIHPDAHIVSPHFDHDRYQWVKRNTYPAEFWWEIAKYCREVGIEFLATPMSRGAAELLNEEIGVDSWKVGSGDILDFVMLDYIRDTGKPVILSSGMSSLEELKKSYEYVHEKVREVSVMHCVSMYPCPLECLNLNTIPFLKRQFPDATIGFSDHSLGIEGALMAVKLGAGIIEKHFTLNRDAWGPDHRVSLLPEEMEKLTFAIKNEEVFHRFWDHVSPQVPDLSTLPQVAPEALGVPTKYLHHEEEKFRPIFRKGLYAAREIKEGEILERDDFYAMRPKLDGALPSEEYPRLLETIATRDFKKYDPITA